VPAKSGRWRLEGFLEHLDIWIESEQPFDDLRLTVTAWILTSYEDPYQGVQRQPDFENLWFGEIPRTRHAGTAVACSYWLYERTGALRCNSVATLALPF